MVSFNNGCAVFCVFIVYVLLSKQVSLHEIDIKKSMDHQQQSGQWIDIHSRSGRWNNISITIYNCRCGVDMIDNNNSTNNDNYNDNNNHSSMNNSYRMSSPNLTTASVNRCCVEFVNYNAYCELMQQNKLNYPCTKARKIAIQKYQHQ